MTHKELDKLRQAGAVSDVLGHCFDAHGKFIETDLKERLVSIPVNVLKGFAERIAVAGGEYKLMAIRGAL